MRQGLGSFNSLVVCFSPQRVCRPPGGAECRGEMRLGAACHSNLPSPKKERTTNLLRKGFGGARADVGHIGDRLGAVGQMLANFRPTDTWLAWTKSGVDWLGSIWLGMDSIKCGPMSTEVRLISMHFGPVVKCASNEFSGLISKTSWLFGDLSNILERWPELGPVRPHLRPLRPKLVV